MSDDAAFVEAILANPQDDNLRLVYADWLEERGDTDSAARADFLRRTVELAKTPGRKGWKKARRKDLQKLAAGLDTDWLAAVSRLSVENCHAKRTAPRTGVRLPLRVQFEFRCDRRWEDLRTTDDRAVRFCEGCQQNVHYCDTIMAAREHAQAGHCVAVDIGVIRRERDLEPEGIWMGLVRPDFWRQERERMQPDPVSAERERRKQAEKAKANLE